MRRDTLRPQWRTKRWCCEVPQEHAIVGRGECPSAVWAEGDGVAAPLGCKFMENISSGDVPEDGHW